MTTDLKLQIHVYGAQLIDSQAAVTDTDVADVLGNVRQVPPPAVRVHSKPRFWVAVATAAAVLVILGTLSLLTMTGDLDTPPATSPPTVTSPTSPPTTRTETLATILISAVEIPIGWTSIQGTVEEIPEWITGQLNGEYIALRPGISGWTRHEDGTVDIDDPDGDDRAWIYRSSDGVDWTRHRLPQFDGQFFEAGITGGVLFANPVAPHDPAGTYGVWRSEDGINWEPVSTGDDQNTQPRVPGIREWLANAFHGPQGAALGSTIVSIGDPSGNGCPIWTSMDSGRTFDCIQVPVDLESGLDTASQQFTYEVPRFVGTVGDGFFITIEEQIEDRAEYATTRVLYSPDGQEWRVVDVADLPRGTSPINLQSPLAKAQMNGRTYVISPIDDELGVYVAEATETSPVDFTEIGRIAVDPGDGWWTLHGDGALTLVYNNGEFRGPESVWTSIDGTEWHPIDLPSNNQYASPETVMVAGDSLFVPLSNPDGTGLTLWVSDR